MNSALITLVGVIITAFVTWSIAQRRIAVENVTKERAKWRREVRNLASQIHDEMLSLPKKESRIASLKMKLSVLLDPCDERDEDILALIKDDDLALIKDDDGLVKDFEARVKLLLKHDWERSKLEAGFFLCRWFLRVRRFDKCDTKKCDTKKCDVEKCDTKKCDVEKCDVEKREAKCCRKYEIRRFRLICSLVMLLAFVVVIALIYNCMYCFEICWCCQWLNSTCDAIDIESINPLFGCPGSWLPSNCQTY